MHVTEQGPPVSGPHGPTLTDPPCPAPPGGWAVGSGSYRSTAAYAYARQHLDEVISLDLFSPKPRSWVMTIASTDPARTMSSLTRDYPKALCVVRSRYTRAEVRDNAAVVRRLYSARRSGEPPRWVTGVEVNPGPDGQPRVEVSVVFDNAAVRQALASLPAGLVVILPWLRPVSG
jgi:hypothetical protein